MHLENYCESLKRMDADAVIYSRVFMGVLIRDRGIRTCLGGKQRLVQYIL